jgi:hypothetical protein
MKPQRPQDDDGVPDAVSPDPETPLVDGEDASDADEAAAAQAKVIERLQTFSAFMTKKRADWIAARAARGIDRRWQEDVDQYNGVDWANRMASSMMETVEQGYPVLTHENKPTRSTVYVPVTRQKTNAAAARLADVMLPTDERNFGIKPTPIPFMPDVKPSPVAAPAQGGASTGTGDLARQTPNGATPSVSSGTSTGGQPPSGMTTAVQQAVNGGAQAQGPQQDPATADLTPVQQAILAQFQAAKKASDAMQEEIEDCFDECDFNAEMRRVLFDCALLGTGVMMGPIVVKRTGRKWTRVTDAAGAPSWRLEVAEELRPATFRVDPRCFYPDPGCGENVQNGTGAFRYERKTVKQLRQLAKQPEYNLAQLRQVLEEGPQFGRALETAHDQEDHDPTADNVYEHWFYWGEVDKDDLIAAGVKVPDDILVSTSACIEMINSTIVRAYLNPLPDGALPYDMVPWELHPGSCWGYGVPYLMRAQQRVINSAWRMLLDNQGLAAGPQIVIRQGSITPADGSWAITARKVWYADDDIEDVSKAFQTFEFNSHQQELQNVLQMAEQLADVVSAVPMLSAGQENVPQTVGGMQVMMNQANVMLRRLVKHCDDRLVKPHIHRYYDYLMEYSDRDDIKGDFQVIALGSSALVVRDIQNQALVQMLALASNPTFAPLINVQKLFEAALRAQHVDPADIMNTPAEIAQAQQRMAQAQQPDPRIVASQQRAQIDQQRVEAQVQMNQATLQSKENISQAQLQVQLETLNVQREIEMLRLSQKQNLSLQQIKADLAAVAIQERSRQDLAAAQVHVQGARPGVM